MEALIQTIKRLHDVHCLLGSVTSKKEDGDHNNNNIFNNNSYITNNSDPEQQPPMALGHWLPQIVVVGALGVGKSSIIESLVGRRFLPKGTGAATTRRPLVVQFVFCTKKELARMATETNNLKLEAWGVFQHKPEHKFCRFEDIKQEIQHETNRAAGEKHGISPDPIHLKIYSGSVNFTIVDLPGLIETPLRDQPHDTANKIKNIVLNYISVPNSIILTVVAANTDFTNSESLKLAHQVDPEGLRTLLVVTKLDLMDSGTDATELLLGKILKIRLGIVGVVNLPSKGSQKLSISQALEEEELFFKCNYPKIAAQHGVSSLSKVLQNLLLENIRLTTPDLRRRILQKINQLQSILDSYGDPILDKGQTLLQLINDFTSNYCSLIVGNFHDLDTGELCCGARIAYIFQESFGNALNSIDPLAGLTKVAMLTAIRNASGTRPGLFVPEVSFELLVKKQIAKLEEPSIRCADLVHEELENLVKVRAQNCNPLLKRFPVLHRRITDKCLEIIKKQLPITHNMIRQTVAIQLAYINTNHPDFIREVHGIQNPAGSSCRMQESVTSLGASWEEQQDGGNRTGRLQEAGRSQSHVSLKPNNSITKFTNAQDRENHDSLVIEHLIKTYFNIVRKTVQDNVPKIIMHSMVNHVTESLQQLLVSQLYSPDLIGDLLTESEEVTKFRKDVEERIACLKMAAEILQSLKDPAGSREERSRILVL